MVEYYFDNGIDKIIKESLILLEETKAEDPIKFFATYFTSKISDQDFEQLKKIKDRKVSI